jgi:DNA-binding MarR family transcriptional regulator
MSRKNTSSTASRSSRKQPANGPRPGPARKPVPKKSTRLRNAVALPSPLEAVQVPPPGEGKRGEQGYFAYLLRQAAAASRLTLERSLAELGATQPQFLVLTMLKAYPGLSGADLARVAMLTPQTVGVIIRNLERDGAILMTPHPVHGRVLQWTLTRRGLALLEKCRKHATALERRLAAGLSPQAQATVRRWLARIAADLQQ